MKKHKNNSRRPTEDTKNTKDKYEGKTDLLSKCKKVAMDLPATTDGVLGYLSYGICLIIIVILAPFETLRTWTAALGFVSHAAFIVLRHLAKLDHDAEEWWTPVYRPIVSKKRCLFFLSLPLVVISVLIWCS